MREAGVDVERIQDTWGTPYQFEFDVDPFHVTDPGSKYSADSDAVDGRRSVEPTRIWTWRSSARAPTSGTSGTPGGTRTSPRMTSPE